MGFLDKESDFIIGFANINCIDLDQMFYIELCAEVYKKFSTNDLSIDTHYHTDLDSIQETAGKKCKKYVLFTDLPPDSAFSDGNLSQIIQLGEGNLASRVNADSYFISKLFFTNLLTQHENIELHVITGAPYERLSNFEILSISKKYRITVERKSKWIREGDYYGNYFKYVLFTLTSIFSPKVTIRGNNLPKSLVTQTSRLSVIIFCEQDNSFGEDISNILFRRCGEMSFNFGIIKDINYLESVLKDQLFDGLFFIDIPGNRVMQVEKISLVYNYLPIFYLSSKDINNKRFNDNVRSFYLPYGDKGVSFDIIQDCFLNHIEKYNRIPDNIDNVKKHLLDNYYRLLNENADSGYHRANNYIVKRQHFLFESIQNSPGYSVFLSLSNINDFSEFIKILPFISPYSILTFDINNDIYNERPVDNKGIEVKNINLLLEDLWNLPNGFFGFCSPKELYGILQNNKELLTLGNIQFLPSPNLFRVTLNNYLDFMPNGRELIENMGDRPVYIMNKNPDSYFPAASLGSFFAFNGTSENKFNDLNIIANLEIPYIQSLDSLELSKLLNDEQESIFYFRDYAQNTIEDCRASLQKDEDISRILGRFKREMTHGTKKLEDTINRLKRTNKIELVMGTVLTAGLTISSAFNYPIPQSLVAFVGSGGAVGIALSYMKYLNDLQNIKNNQFHFLWKIKSKIKS